MSGSIRKIRIILCVFAVTSFVRVNSQIIPACDLRFINHLIGKGSYEEALFLLNSENCDSYQMSDSINYLKGLSYRSLKSLDMSSQSFLKISPTSPLFIKSRFFASYNYSQAGNYKLALEALENAEMTSDFQIALKNHEIAGVRLLQGDLISFYTLMSNCDRYLPGIIVPATNLIEISEEIISYKSKSPFVAGLFSAILPGSGKFYAGKKGEAAATFLSTSGFALVALDNYRQRGINDFKTIVFGAIFAISYLANIYGSAFSVTIMENEYRENVKSRIMFNLHIPINTAFNK